MGIGSRKAVVFAGFLAFLAVLAALVAASSWASEQAIGVSTVTAIQGTADQVHLSVGGQVFTTDPDGHVLGRFRDRDGRPWHTDVVSSISREPDGRYLVSELDDAHVAEFDPTGHLLRTLTLPFVPHGRTEVAALGDGVFVSGTMDGDVSLVDRDGHLYRSRKVRYPNGANLITTPKGPAVAFVSTYQGRVYALDARLHVVSVPLVDAINRLRASGQGLWGDTSIVDLWMAPDASRALLSISRSDSGDCAYVSVTADGRVRVLGDTDAIRSGGQLDPDDMMSTEAVAPVAGHVLAASPRAATVLSFLTGDRDAPPFCRACTLAEVSRRARSFADAAPGMQWPNGTWISDFGDATLRRHYHAAWKARARYRALATDTRAPLYVFLALLLAGWAVSRVSAADDGSQLPVRLEALWARLLRPAAGTLLGALGMVVGSAAAGILVGHLAFGTGGALVCGGVVAWGASRLWITPWLVRHQLPATARAAFDLYYGPGAPRDIHLAEGEAVAYAAFALPVRQGLEKLAGVASGALDSDFWDVITSAIPRAVLVVRTTRRLLVVKCSSWGSPLADPAVLPVITATDAPAGLIVTRQGEGGVAAFRLGTAGRPGEALTTAPPTYLCMECGKPEGTCSHRPPALNLALLLSALLPGLGQLAQRRFGPGRLLTGLTVLSLVALGHGLVPQLEGTLPWDPLVLYGPAAALVILWLTGLGELLLDVRLGERRARLARGI